MTTHYEFHLSPSGPPVLVPRDIPSGEQVKQLLAAITNPVNPLETASLPPNSPKETPVTLNTSLRAPNNLDRP